MGFELRRIGPQRGLEVVNASFGDLVRWIVPRPLQRRLWHVDDADGVEPKQDRPEDESGRECPDEDGDLLRAWGGADQKARLEILRSRSAVRSGDANDGADRKRRHIVGGRRPSDRKSVV